MPQPLPGFESLAATFEQPFEMLSACHDRVRRSLQLLVRLQDHLLAHGADDQARQAAEDIVRYFGLAAPAHHEDEERHVVPILQIADDVKLRKAAQQMLQDHALIRSAWLELAPFLQQIGTGSAPQRTGFAEAVDRFVRLHDDHLRLEDELGFPEARARHEAQGPAAIAAIGGEMARRRRAR
ncbi:hemerythrin domain-containing protein [Aquincola sp. S2]|uniref:Hemerythrin domain-containing protein n=2 Tax=Pseudaquabacterium terrae TaxID=2732868 RepID=A0ABX2EQX8_9BURK|nr:hemerythrin domain-containing protein [Aquabacterium terrae]